MTGARTLIAGALGVILIGASAGPVHPSLVWNLSVSVPIGLYVIDAGAPRLGDYVLIQLPAVVAELASERGYLPTGVALLKKVSAAQNDRVCRIGQQIIINGIAIARAAARDLSDRPMPVWTGCRNLKAGDVFLLGGGPYSFDSRYFGPVSSGDVVGRATPLATWLFRATAFGDGCRQRQFELHGSGEAAHLSEQDKESPPATSILKASQRDS